jgi:hypothetical protein
MFVVRLPAFFRVEKITEERAQAKAQSPSTTRNPHTNEKACARQAFEFGRELLRGPRYGKYSIAEVTCCFSRRSNFDAPV